MFKKAQNISVNVIIIAILALLVLVILGFVFTGKLGDFVKGTKACESVGGMCQAGDQCPQGYGKTITASCLDGNGKVNPAEVCCIKTDPTVAYQ